LHKYLLGSTAGGIMAGLVSITRIEENEFKKLEKDDDFRAYCIVSTAQNNVEDTPEDKDNPSISIQEIAAYILNKKQSNPQANIDIVVQIHGYNTGDGYQEDYRKASLEIAKIQRLDKSPDRIVIFLGYAWPSEKIRFFSPIFTALNGALTALPGWLKSASVLGIIGIATILLIYFLPGFGDAINRPIQFNLSAENSFGWLSATELSSLLIFILQAMRELLRLALLIAILFLMPTVVLILLRMSGYFRDSYRATNYGVPDLVQFFRAFEYVLLEKQNSQPNMFYGKNRIRLSFIGHSMGGFVTTNLVRVLSDVFDNIDTKKNVLSDVFDNKDAQGNKADALSVIDGDKIVADKGKKRSSIGQCFSLERLILVSPDIPLNAILSGRSNFLSSSLSRFQESYLFSNEGDMVLLLLSTVANYISFPSTTGLMGYKLGNIGIEKHYVDNDDLQKYTMSRFPRVGDELDAENVLLKKLVIGIDHEKLIKTTKEEPFVAQEFTYFDCTDYLRCKLSRKKENPRKYQPLNLINYAALIRDIGGTHSGYFDQAETREAIYTLACKGFHYFQEETVTGNEIITGVHGIKILRAND
jgi:hypothetical protein